MSLFSRRPVPAAPELRPVRIIGRMARLVQGGASATLGGRAVEGALIEVVLGADEPPPDWPEAVAVHLDGRSFGWVNGGGEPMRAALRDVAARGLYLVVPGTVERVQGDVVLRLAAPWPADVAGWLAGGAEVDVHGVAVVPRKA